MNKIIYIALIFLFAGCSSEKSWDCIQTSGTIIQQEVAVASFTKILVWDRIKVFIAQGEEQKVIVETGENLIDDISVTVVNGKLEIKNNNSCNFVRDYDDTKVYLTAPDITEIRSSTGYTIESIGKLKYPVLSLYSEDHEQEDLYNIDGDFKLDLEVENLSVVANGLSKFYLSGTATRANFGLFAGDCRVYSENLIVEDLTFYHRSTGPMVVNPQQTLRGQIVSLGDVIAKNRPAVVEVEQLYRGQLIFD